MANDIPSILHHVSVGTDDLERASAIYDSVMPHLGASRMMSFPFAVAYGKQFPKFWIGKPLEQSPAQPVPDSVLGAVRIRAVAKSAWSVRAFLGRAAPRRW